MTPIQQAINILRNSRNIFVITGAGLSADSGLPTYRGVSGLYNGKDTEDGIPVEMALAGEMLRRRPEVTWKYLSQIESACRNAAFNRGHEVIAAMEERFNRVVVLTQNIDGFHKAAGSTRVIDIHGDIHYIFCESCGWEKHIRDFSEINIPPVCPECHGPARPDVVFFGEQLSYEKMQILFDELGKDFDVYFSIGTSSLFPYIQEPVLRAKKRGVPSIEINPFDTELSDVVDIRIRQGAAIALDEIWEGYLNSITV